MEMAGYLASLIIGVSLGLLGGGGSILTVPVLVYLFMVPSVEATTYSLFIVGITSGIGSLSYFKRRLIVFKTAVVFGLPSILAVILMRSIVLPEIPNVISFTKNIFLNKEKFILLLFALVMMLAGMNMLRREKEENLQNLPTKNKSKVYSAIAFAGLLEGSLSGLVGAGGGFLIIPSLVLFCKIPMKQAVGTSLFIISVKSILGFIADKNVSSTNWYLILYISLFALMGLAFGILLSKKIEGKKLKPLFGWFLLAMSIYILIKEITV